MNCLLDGGAYAAAGGNSRGLKQSLKALDPLFGLSPKEKAAFYSTLSKDEQAMLVRAYQFYQQVLEPPVGDIDRAPDKSEPQKTSILKPQQSTLRQPAQVRAVM